MPKIYLPKKKNIQKIKEDDPLNFYYLPFIGYIYRKRLINTLSLLENYYDSLLEIGYGSGILLPTLKNWASKIYGLEIHQKENIVYEMLKKENIDIRNIILKSGSILDMPFEDNFFECVISISTLEHILQLEKAFSEIKRVLKPNGKAILSFPARNIFTNLFYKIAGYNPKDIHPSSHNDILNEAKKHFIIEKIIKFPNLKKNNYPLYYSIRCLKLLK